MVRPSGDQAGWRASLKTSVMRVAAPPRRRQHPDAALQVDRRACRAVGRDRHRHRRAFGDRDVDGGAPGAAPRSRVRGRRRASRASATSACDPTATTEQADGERESAAADASWSAGSLWAARRASQARARCDTPIQLSRPCRPPLSPSTPPSASHLLGVVVGASSARRCWSPRCGRWAGPKFARGVGAVGGVVRPWSCCSAACGSWPAPGRGSLCAARSARRRLAPAPAFGAVHRRRRGRQPHAARAAGLGADQGAAGAARRATGPALTSVALDNAFYTGSVVLVMIAAGAWVLVRRAALARRRAPRRRSACSPAVVVGALVAPVAGPAPAGHRCRGWRSAGRAGHRTAGPHARRAARHRGAVLRRARLARRGAAARGRRLAGALPRRGRCRGVAGPAVPCRAAHTSLADAFVLESTGRLVIVCSRWCRFAWASTRPARRSSPRRWACRSATAWRWRWCASCASWCGTASGLVVLARARR